MKDFIHTGWYAPTLTTFEDPSLKVIETDNGYHWSISFYVGNQKIDHIDMEWLNGSKLDENVLNLPVYNNEGLYLGKLIDRLEYAYDLMHY